MDYENTAWVRNMLRPGENLLWTGRPGKRQLFEAKDIPALIFGIIWCSIGVSVAWRDWNSPKSSLLSRLIMVAFLLIGFYSLAWRFILKLKTLKESYALTSQRIILNTGKTFKTLFLTELPRMSVIQKSDGSGSIFFGEEIHPNYRSNSTVANRTCIAALQGIPDVNQVENRIRTAAEQALAARRSED